MKRTTQQHTSAVSQQAMMFLSMTAPLWAAALIALAAILLGACGSDGSVVESEEEATSSTLLFSATDASSGFELWKTDGTAAGTAMVREIRPGTPDGIYNGGGPLQAVTIGGITYFAADDGTSGVELWKTDGTAAGTERVRDIADAPGTAASSYPGEFAAYNGLLYFAAENLAAGRELWRSDGTEAGTFRVKDIRGGGDGDPRSLIVSGGLLYFTADDGNIGVELWSSDGTTAGTIPVRDLNTNGDGALSGIIAALGDGVLFRGDNGSTNAEPAFSDGTAGNTYVVADVWSGGGSSFASEYTTLGNQVLFSANDGAAAVGTELWVTDGIGATALEIRPGTGSAFPSGLTPFKGEVYFTATDGTTGYELWKSDGTPGGTVPVANIAAEPTPGSSFPSGLQAVGDTLFFFTRVATNHALWRTDGTPGAEVKVLDLPDPGFCTLPLGALGDRLLFVIDADGDALGELWVSDGTAAGTEELPGVGVFNCGG